MSRTMKIEMVSTGDEVLYGQITDTNAAWLSDFLFQQGFLVSSRFTVGDDLTQLIHTLQTRSKENDILIVNGGLGPTSDDLTALAAAKANNDELILHQEWVAKMEQYFACRGNNMSPKNLKQAMLPASATLVDNSVGTACGFRMVMNGCHLFFTPGVPFEFQEMVKTQILPEIRQLFPDVDKPLCYRLTTMGRSESDLASEIEQRLSIPANINVGYRSAMPIIELKLTARQSLQAQMNSLWAELASLVSDNLLYEGTIGLARLVSTLLKQQSLQLLVLTDKLAAAVVSQLYDADAPLIKAEIFGDNDPLNAQILTWQMHYPHAIILSLTGFSAEEPIFTLQLITPKQAYHYTLKYTGRIHNNQIQQEIFSAVGLDALRRYLTQQPLVGPNIWLDVIEAGK
ncbi:molybdenum cofactor synthesis domain-containing protein/competence/damage-inducible protein CinA-like protein [Orbus hercynius]|uniref:Molybdenum cofactor synthesis domain-containing protein/competence/damage-inducible protein CinA-like protein n=1 Tax=Orbus hercynius TaxID=593135 RepID=A0A495RCM3_9GAMM|nr:CinA family nicotinamide mononucleotide deamidase-related protein [Orbus hercynius]RKS85223.1 molybdenum cofactor synthesis domain-containing protein/competence/damage-inducible protein CinA-like protein [Orbus hercynius]